MKALRLFRPFERQCVLRLGISNQAIWTRAMATQTDSSLKLRECLENVKQCDIDMEGSTFKYILIKVKPKDKRSDLNLSKTLVRGYGKCYYHCDILDEVEERDKLGSKGFVMDCLGGGRIRHGKNSLHIYGYSQGYGKADHDVTKALLRKEFPDYEITISDEGY